MALKIIIINGPNLNLLGKREPEIYGSETFEFFFEKLKDKFTDIELSYYQSNHEGSIIDKLHEVGFSYDGIVINPGAYTHYSYAISDAIAAITTAVVEVHISDIHTRESFRQISVTSVNCQQMISGKGLDGYKEAIAVFTLTASI
jgi:3-dehydroquinate dehydratase-2